MFPIGIPSNLDLLDEDVDKVDCELSLANFVKSGWHVIEPSTKLEWNWHLTTICDHLQAVSEGRIRNLIINIPPRSLKSSIISIMWPAWTWTRYPHKRWMFGSYASSLSVRDSIRCRRVIESEWYQERWGDICKLQPDQNRQDEFANSSTGHRYAVSVGSVGTGLGCDIIVGDDINKASDAFSETALQNAVDWWDTTMTTRLDDLRTGAKVIVQQRVCEKDITGHLLKKGGYELLVLPAEYNASPEAPRSNTSLNFVDPRKEDGELLFEQRIDRDILNKLKRDLGSSAYASQINQDPIPSSGNMVKREWFKFYHVLPEFDYIILSFDFTFKESKKSDYVAGLAVGVKGANKYILPSVVHEKLNFTGMVSALRTFVYKHSKYRELIIEAKANGEAIIDVIKDEFSAVYPYSPSESKEARFASITPEIEAGNVLLPDPMVFEESKIWLDDFITELVRFPKGSHDDFCDALSQLIIRVKSSGGGWEERVKYLTEITEDDPYEKVKNLFGWK